MKHGIFWSLWKWPLGGLTTTRPSLQEQPAMQIASDSFSEILKYVMYEENRDLWNKVLISHIFQKTMTESDQILYDN